MMFSVPAYWWDKQQDRIVVQSNQPDGACIEAIPFKDDASAAIRLAEQRVADYAEGRAMPRKAA
jgi:hypothetical protein